ncbi:MAG TPA: FxSxx-COOH system tetratricopeptide repeat protein, partial [Pseudonocardiaceae bacterium]|nr:FxSxx-COOH system tetratricopeptide repeat protein [Pseudonocardiaceae bacterium]
MNTSLPEHDTGAASLGTVALTWSEVADALWLASVTQNTQRQRTAPKRAAQDGPGPPAETDLPSDHSDHSVAHESSPKLYRESWLAQHDISDHQSRATPTLLAADLGALTRPAAPILAGAEDMARALRPLKRKVMSWHDNAVILDEDATAERAVQDGLWLPVTKQDMVRWLDLTLVIDASPSMALWRPTITAIISLVHRLGAFRSIQLRLLDTHETPAGSPAGPVLRGGTPGTAIRSPAELLDSSGRRILLVLTDGVGQCWREGLVSPVLAQWAGTMPVAVLHLLPQRLWARGGLTLHRSRLSVPGPLRPNQLWGLEWPDSWLEPDPASAVPADAVPVPVLELKARWLGWWARLITGSNRGPAGALVLLASREDPPHTPAPHEARGSNGSASGESLAWGQVMNFLSVASPPAYRLATLLAAVPVSVPVARLVQAELVPESGPDHLVEVLTSGLLRPPATAATGHTWDAGAFHFADSVREILLSGARRAETARVVRLVTKHFGDQISPLRRFRDALEDPDSTPDPEFTADTAQMATIERAVMRALSGPYLSRADRLHSRECDHPPTGQATVSLPSTPVSDPETLVSVTDRTDLTSKQARLSTSVLDSPASDVEPSVRASTADIPITPRPNPLPEFPPVYPRENQPLEVPLIWGNVPARNPNFTGRIELLDQLGERLTAGGATGGATAVLPAALHGMGGIGKTQMAVEYVYRHLRDYDVVWWIQATHEPQVRTELTELAARMRLPGSSEAHTAVPAVLEALRVGQPYHRWLLIFDSAESPDVVHQFFPTNGPGQILVTSRNPEWAGYARPLEVAVFTREESTELLRRRDPAIYDEEADRLADALGDLPLAIAQAAAWRAETGMPVAEYLRLFDEQVAEILNTEGPTGYEISVAAAWNVSLDRLRTLNPAAHQLLQVCAFFGAEPISRDLFRGARNVSIAEELDKALRDPIQLSRTIRDISRYGLAKIDHRNNTLQLHRLVQLVVSNRMTAQRRAEMSHGAHLLLANFDPDDPIPPKWWQRYQDILPHAFASKVIECEDAWVRNIVTNLTEAMYFWGDYEAAARLAKQAVDIWTEKLGPTHQQTLQAARQLGYYLWTLGRYAEAAQLNQKTVELHRQVSGENSEETVMAELAVATDLKGQGEFIAALELNEQVFQKARGLFGDDDPATLITAHDLAVSLGLVGEYRKQQKLAEDTY